MSNGGWIKWYRSFLEWEWWSDINVFRVFCYLLLSVEPFETKWHGIVVLPGQKITTVPEIADKTGLSIKAVRIALEKLSKTGEITASKGARSETAKKTIITVKNWDLYQAQGREDGTINDEETARKGREDGNLHNNNIKNKRNKEKKSITRRRARGSYDLEEEAERAMARFAGKEAAKV